MGIYELSDDKFRELVATSLNLPEVLFKLGYDKSDSKAYGMVRRRMLDLGCYNKKSIKDASGLLVEHCKHNKRTIRNYIIENSILPYKCACCGISDWNGRRLSLHLDHINGKVEDNRIENLRFLCPNCHSQFSVPGIEPDEYNDKSEQVIEMYLKKSNIDYVANKLGLSRLTVRSILSNGGYLTPNQKFVIQYDVDDNEVRRFGSIGECCRWMIDSGFVRTKKVSTCRAEFYHHSGKEWNGYRFEIIGCLKDNK